MTVLKYITEDTQISAYNNDGKELAIIAFSYQGDNTISIDHTIVDDSLQGKGVAGILTEKVYEKAKRENKKIIPICAYAISWFEKNIEKQDVLAK